MGTRRLHLLTNLRRWLGFYMGRPWRSKERLHVPLDEVHPDSDYEPIERPDGYGGSYYVVPLLDESDRTQRRDSEDHRPRSFTASSIGPRSETWTVASPGEPSYTVSFDSAARYSDCE